MIEITPNLTEGNVPIYIQLYRFLKKEIESGRIPPSTRLPSIRKLSEYLKISKNTVESTYQQLIAEGYIESRPRSGLYVIEVTTDIQSLSPKDSVISTMCTSSEKLPAGRLKTYEIDFSYGKIDLKHFPFSIWKRLTNYTLNVENRELLLYGDPQGEMGFRTELVKYLRDSRGVICSPDQVIISAGTQQSLSLLCQILGIGTQTIAMEEPGYDGARSVFQNHSYNVRPIQLDADGINIEELRASSSQIVYITPSHQFPNGMVMSYLKRKGILQWAIENNSYIIEDDYDGEFRYRGTPIPALQGLDNQGKVIYIGTFSKSLLPSIRISYMILPKQLLQIYFDRFQIYEQTVSRIHQLTLQTFMEKGYWNSHIRKMRRVYQKKQEELIYQLRNSFGSRIEVIGLDSGLHILIKVQNQMSEEELISSASRVGVKVCPTSRYYINYDKVGKTHPMILLGFGSLSIEDIRKGINLLKKAWLN